MPEQEDRGKKKWYILEGHFISLLVVLLLAILFYVGLTHFDVIAVRIKMFMKVLSPFIAGFAIAYLLNTPMCFFERKLYKNNKYRRVLAITTVYLRPGLAGEAGQPGGLSRRSLCRAVRPHRGYRGRGGDPPPPGSAAAGGGRFGPGAGRH